MVFQPFPSANSGRRDEDLSARQQGKCQHASGPHLLGDGRQHVQSRPRQRRPSLRKRRRRMGRVPAGKARPCRLARNVRQPEIPWQSRSSLQTSRSMARKEQPRLQRRYPQGDRANARGQAGWESRGGITKEGRLAVVGAIFRDGPCAPSTRDKLFFERRNENGNNRSYKSKSRIPFRMARGQKSILAKGKREIGRASCRER